MLFKFCVLIFFGSLYSIRPAETSFFENEKRKRRRKNSNIFFSRLYKKFPKLSSLNMCIISKNGRYVTLNVTQCSDACKCSVLSVYKK